MLQTLRHRPCAGSIRAGSNGQRVKIAKISGVQVTANKDPERFSKHAAQGLYGLAIGVAGNTTLQESDIGVA